MFANQALESPSERGGGEPCIGDCRAAQRLCAQFEDILRHGLKPGWFGKTPTFWPAVLKISRKQAIQYIKRYRAILYCVTLGCQGCFVNSAVSFYSTCTVVKIVHCP